jgi:hypothetical protein
VVVTSKVEFDRWGETLSDDLSDHHRLRHHAEAIAAKGLSYAS